MLRPEGLGERRRPVDRRADRTVTAVGIAIALAYLCAALLSVALPAADRVGSWLPLHLAMAGAASTAIAAVMPFFSAAIATAPPVASAIRWSAVITVAIGAAAVAIGYARGQGGLAALGGLLFILGIALTALATFAPLRSGLGPKGGVVTAGYAAACVFVGIGALLAIGFVAGVEPITSAWAQLKPAHAWLNLVGFVSLVIATTLLHFFPTVIGARIERRRSAYLCVAGLAAGAGLVSVGYAAAVDPIARAGAAITLVGAASLAAYAAASWRTRARWTGDRGWHIFAMGGLVSAIGWFCLSTLLAAGRVLVGGADPASASSAVLLAPFVAGWMGLALLASATHLVPSVGPGGPAAHAAQRALLGRAGAVRLAAAVAGIGALAIGQPLGVDALIVIGWSLMLVAVLGTTGLIGAAIVAGARDARAGDTLRL